MMLDFYNNNAEEYQKATLRIDPTPFLSPLASRLPPASSVLDVGCGVGRDLIWLKNKGFSVCGLEQSQNLLRLAKKNSGCKIIEADFSNFDFSNFSFDALIAIGSLVHLPHDQFSVVFMSIIGAVNTSGLILVTLKEGENCKKSEDGRLFYLWQQEQLDEIFSNCGLQVVSFSRQVSQVQSSDVWLTYLLQKEDRKGS